MSNDGTPFGTPPASPPPPPAWTVPPPLPRPGWVPPPPTYATPQHYWYGQPQDAYASWGTRALATIIDGLVVQGVSIVFLGGGAIVGAIVHGVGGALAGFLGAYVVVAAWSLYYTFHGLMAGHTVGRRSLRYYIARQDGQRIGVLFVLGRQLAAMVSSIAFYIGWLAPLWSPKRQTWHDSIVNTVAVVGEKPNVTTSVMRPILLSAAAALFTSVVAAVAFGPAINDIDWAEYESRSLGGTRDSYCEELFELILLDDYVEGGTQVMKIQLYNGCETTLRITDSHLTLRWDIGECTETWGFDFSQSAVVLQSRQAVVVNFRSPASRCVGSIDDIRYDIVQEFTPLAEPSSGPPAIEAKPR